MNPSVLYSAWGAGFLPNTSCTPTPGTVPTLPRLLEVARLACHSLSYSETDGRRTVGMLQGPR